MKETWKIIDEFNNYKISNFGRIYRFQGGEKMKKVMCCSGKLEMAWEENGMRVCTATHPKTPNWSGHSRGRKIHLAKDSKMTVCNMLVDEYVPDSDKNWSMVGNGKCKVCFKPEVEK